MSKYTKLKEPVLLTNCTERTSRNGGHTMFKLFFVGLKSKQDYHTYAEPINKNYGNWKQIVDAYDRGKGIVLNNLKLKSDQDNLINADSEVRIECVDDMDKVMSVITDWWQEQDSFHKLFDSSRQTPNSKEQ